MSNTKIVGRYKTEQGVFDLTDDDKLLPVSGDANNFSEVDYFESWSKAVIHYIKNPVDCLSEISQ